MTAGRWLLTGAIAGFAGVALGAFGAHALRGVLSAENLAVYQTAIQYLQWHTPALLALGLWAERLPEAAARSLQRAWRFLVAGLLLFCLSLIALALTGVKWLGIITPFGGVALLIGWGLAARAALSAHQAGKSGG